MGFHRLKTFFYFTLIAVTMLATEVTAQKKKDDSGFIPLSQGVIATLKSGGKRLYVSVTGRGKDYIAIKYNNRAKTVKLSKIRGLDLGIPHQEYDVELLEGSKRYAEAAQQILKDYMIVKALIDVPNNNIVAKFMQAGDDYYAAAEQLRISSGRKKDKKKIDQMYNYAYNIYREVSKARWYSEEINARLKMVMCRIRQKKFDKGESLFNKIVEPEIGEMGYGMYWLAKAHFCYFHEEFINALDAATNSYTFETKNLDCFPDALLIAGASYEELLHYYRTRDMFYEVAVLFQNTHWGDEAYKRLKFIVEKGFAKKKENVDISKVFFDMVEDVNKKCEAFIAEQGELREKIQKYKKNRMRRKKKKEKKNE